MVTASRPGLLYLSRADVEKLLDRSAAKGALAEGFKALSAGRVQAPPRPRVDVPGYGFSLAMLAWAPGQRIALKTVNVFDGNHAQGLPSHMAMINLFDAVTGTPVAVMDGALVTGVRTAAAAMLSVDALARPDSRIASVIGAGVQATEHVRMLAEMPGITEIRVYARRHDGARVIAAGSPKAHAVTDVRAAVADADIVCLTTSSATPVIEAEWLKAGAHVTSVGFAPPGSEVPPALVENALVCVEAMSAFSPAPVGCVELAGRDPSGAVEIGALLAGTCKGRTEAGQITLYKSMGNAMEDMVVANLVCDAALTQGVGTSLRL